VKHDGLEHSPAVSVPDGPPLVKDVDLAVLPAASAGSLHANGGSRPALGTLAAMVDELKSGTLADVNDGHLGQAIWSVHTRRGPFEIRGELS
jgi:hypothetical protein